ncbi:MAG: hypothetical protein NTV78_00565 [Caldiserica bacterium]|nr:hypothetical protein [Caldisericota bacterium]
MTNNNKKLVQGKNWFRIFARIVSVPIGWFCFYGIVVSLWEGPSVTLEDIIFAVGYAILLAGVIIAWWREKIGGILLSAYAIIMVVYYVVNAFYKYSITPNLSAWDKFRNSFTSDNLRFRRPLLYPVELWAQNEKCLIKYFLCKF